MATTETREPEYWWSQLSQSPPDRPRGTDRLANTDPDVVVVGSGCAGYVAALSATESGCSVVILEAAETGGGTTFKSGGGYWVPNNSLMRAAGREDDRDEALRYMAELSFPQAFDPEQPDLGLEKRDYTLLTTYYDNAADVVDKLADLGALRSCLYPSFTEEHPGMVSYHSNRVEEWLRHLAPVAPDGKQQIGWGLILQLDAAARERGIELVTNHRVTELIVESDAVVGVVAEAPGGEVRVRARRGVVFASGGFSHDADLIDEVFQGPIYGSCAVPTNRGDFVRIGKEVGAELGNLENGWLTEMPIEAGLEDREQEGVFMPSGDSMIYVDSNGNRVVNEKEIYQERTTIHFVRDDQGRLPYRVLFMIFDDAVASDPRPWSNPWPAGRTDEPYVIRAESLAELARIIDERLVGLGAAIDGLRLAPDFTENLERSVERFNRFAEQARDEDFGRGESLHEIDWNRRARVGNEANPTMFPIAPQGPYYAVLLGAGTLDTNGGPRVDESARVLRRDGSPIPGLFAAGNCISSPTAEAYWSGGSTIGPAMTFGYLAGLAAAGEPARVG